MDVASWLRSLGLEQYEAAFRENAIDRNGSAESDGGGPEAVWASPSSGIAVNYSTRLLTYVRCAGPHPPPSAPTGTDALASGTPPSAAKSR